MATTEWTVGRNIAQTRQRLGISIDELAERLGSGWYYKIRRVEAGITWERKRDSNEYDPLTVGQLELIASALGVPASDLLRSCQNCGGEPPAGYTCSACGAKTDRA